MHIACIAYGTYVYYLGFVCFFLLWLSAAAIQAIVTCYWRLKNIFLPSYSQIISITFYLSNCISALWCERGNLATTSQFNNIPSRNFCAREWKKQLTIANSSNGRQHQTHLRYGVYINVSAYLFYVVITWNFMETFSRFFCHSFFYLSLFLFRSLFLSRC